MSRAACKLKLWASARLLGTSLAEAHSGPGWPPDRRAKAAEKAAKEAAKAARVGLPWPGLSSQPLLQLHAVALGGGK